MLATILEARERSYATPGLFSEDRRVVPWRRPAGEGRGLAAREASNGGHEPADGAITWSPTDRCGGGTEGAPGLFSFFR